KLNRSIERQIRLGRGEHLLLNIVPEGNGFVFERELFGDPGVKSKVKAPWNIRSQKKNDWLLAFHQNRYTKKSELEAMVTLEDLRNRIVPRGGTIQQSKPRMVWFSLTSPGEKQAGWRRLEYGPLARYPAPAWGIRVVGWPQKGPVTATTWWSDQEPTIAGRLRRESGDFTNALAIPRTRVPCVVIEGEDQDTVVVESVQHQGREVESRAGEKKQKENCLVVRLSYPKGKPFFALVPNAIGHEHRFFTDAGKYTGVFFGITEEQ